MKKHNHEFVYNKSQSNYESGTKAYHYNRQVDISDRHKIIVKYIPIIVKGVSDYSDLVMVYEGGSISGDKYTSSTHWSNISTDKKDLMYKAISNSVQHFLNYDMDLQYLIKANKDTDWFAELYEEVIGNNAELFI